MTQQYDEVWESFKGVREHHNSLFTQLKANNAELAALKQAEATHRGEMDEACPNLKSLFKERDGIKSKLKEHRAAIKQLRDKFDEQRHAFKAYQKQAREIKSREWQEQKAARQALYEERMQREEKAGRRPVGVANGGDSGHWGATKATAKTKGGDTRVRVRHASGPRPRPSVALRPLMPTARAGWPGITSITRGASRGSARPCICDTSAGDPAITRFRSWGTPG